MIGGAPFQVNDIHMFKTTLNYIFKFFKSETQFHSDISSDWSAKIISALHSCAFQFQEKIARKNI